MGIFALQYIINNNNQLVVFGCDCQVFLYLVVLYNGAIVTHCDLEGL